MAPEAAYQAEGSGVAVQHVRVFPVVRDGHDDQQLAPTPRQPSLVRLAEARWRPETGEPARNGNLPGGVPAGSSPAPATEVVQTLGNAASSHDRTTGGSR